MIISHNIAENRRIDAEAVTLNDELVVEFGQKATAKDFIAELKGELISNPEIDSSRLGEQEVTFEFYNIKNKKRRRSFTISVVDRTPPVIYGNASYTVYQGYEGDLTELMMSGDNADDRPTREVRGEFDFDRTGEYDAQYIIRDASGNETQKKFRLNVVPPPSDAPQSPAQPAQIAGVAIDEIIKQHKTQATKIGVDVSSWQGEIDWQKAKRAGVEFAFIRLGYQADFGAEYTTDKMFAKNIAGARKAGLPVGVYFYSCADSVDEAKRQAEWVKAQIEDYEVELGVAFDWEEWRDFNRAGVSFSTLNRMAKAFIDTIEAAGYRGMLYGSTNYVQKFWQDYPYKIWLAQYHDHVTYTGEYMIWQLSDAGEVPGIEAYVDSDVLYLENED